MSLRDFKPMPLGRSRGPFSHPDWIFEIKWDGFRALALIDEGGCRLISRNGNPFGSFRVLSESLPVELRSARSAVLDGEIVCVDSAGKSQFRDLLFHRGDPRFYAFDVLSLDGADLLALPLIERKRRLRAVIPTNGNRLLYSDHVAEHGEDLFRLACENDLEGVVAKLKGAPYSPELDPTWLKIRNRHYSQWAGRADLFERERGKDPDQIGWDACAGACAVAAAAW